MSRALGMLLAAMVLVGTSVPGWSDAVTPKEVIKLFNGKDLTNFYTWLKDFGKNNDPKKVITVTDGMLFIRGDVDGGAITEKEYENYRLVVEWKWGDKTWPPREKGAMDSGIFLHCGDDPEAGGAYPSAFEFQVFQGSTGDMLLIPGKGRRSITVEVDERGRYYKPGGQSQAKEAAAPQRFIVINHEGKDPAWRNVKGFRGKNDVEKPQGEWNTCEAISDKDTLTYIVNGKTVMKGTKTNITKGRILLQSEGAEIYFRKVELHPLK